MLSLSGYRFFRPTLLVLGACAAGLPVWILTWDHAGDAFTNVTADGALGLGCAAGAVTGILGGLLCWRFFRVGVFTIGALLGVLIALVLNIAVFVHLVPAAQANTPFIAGGVLLGGAFGALALRFMKPSVIVSTSAVGAYAAIRSVGLFVGNYPNEFDLENRIQSGQTLTTEIYGYLAGMAVLAIVGAFVQIRFTAPKVKSGEKDANEIAFDDAEDDFGESALRRAPAANESYPTHTHTHTLKLTAAVPVPLQSTLNAYHHLPRRQISAATSQRKSRRRTRRTRRRRRIRNLRAALGQSTLMPCSTITTRAANFMKKVKVTMMMRTTRMVRRHMATTAMI
jgi:hypothetical protein